jgi:hypothetical protein
MDQLEVLKKRIEEQGKTGNDDEDAKRVAKDATKAALFELLLWISGAPKEDLTAEQRHLVDTALVGQDDLKWPLLRALEDPQKYRAFLGLPMTMEQTRKYLCQISVPKLKEILNNIDVSAASSQDLTWVDKVLQFMTGDGRRKKDLGGFVLMDKSVVKAAINKASKRRKELEQASRVAEQASRAAGPQKKVEYEIERDVRVLDHERNEARAAAIGALIDKAVGSK